MPNALLRRCVNEQKRVANLLTNTTLFLVILVGLITTRTVIADDIKCFCDRLSCPGSLMCTGKWCLIGISTDGGNGRLDQICGSDDRDRPMDCAKNWNRWTEVCACNAPLCNTFAYLRSNIDSTNDAQDETALYAHSNMKKFLPGQSPTRARGWYQGGNLIILLVILPLAVGGLAVCLVFVNYHCKMN